MAMWLQHVLVIGVAVACAGVIARMGFKTLRGSGKLGACCARGCEPSAKTQATQRVMFLPVEMLRPSKRGR
jgi:hypothetical protein